MEIAGGVQVEDRFPEFGFAGTEDLAELRNGPEVKFTLDPFAVGILGRKESALPGGHVPQDIGEDVPGGYRRTARRRTRDRPRGKPGPSGPGHRAFSRSGAGALRVGGVAVEPEPHVVPDAAPAHGAQRALHHLQRPGLAGALVAAQQEQQPVRGGEFRGRLETAVATVKAEGDVVVGAVQQAQAGFLGRTELKGPAQVCR